MAFLLIASGWIGGAAARGDQDEASRAFQEGRFGEAIQLADEAIEFSPFPSEFWFLLKGEAQLATGAYGDAAETLQAGLEKFPREVAIRELGVRIAQFNDDYSLAQQLAQEIQQFWDRDAWRYRDPGELVAIARSQLRRGRDARSVLNEFLDRAVQRDPDYVPAWLAIGELGLAKQDDAVAAENFQQAAKLAPDNPEAWFGLARAFRDSDSGRANQALESALEIDPNHVGSLLLQVDHLVNTEAYAEAEAVLERVLAVNPHDAQAWSYRAVLAHLGNDPKREAECREKALEYWSRNPAVDHLIGKKLSQKYRFQEGERYQRRALIYDPNFLPARIQLAHDLLRLGQELEGWKLADEVFDADQYSVVAHNLVNLRNELADFVSLEEDGFVVRMSRGESTIYGPRVLEVLRTARQELEARYRVQLETPIFVEIFPRQQDFAIRTFGLPGGEGFLGVCFGRVITMTSPAARNQPTNWESVLWHEFCHVVTLQKTRNRMPRWLSEGISVFEERRRDPAWGQAVSPEYRQFLVDGEGVPLSKLSGAFLTPKSPAHLDLAYFEASMAVEFLMESYGKEPFLALLEDLALGTPIADSLRRHTAPLAVLDRQFEEFLAERVVNYAPAADWSPPEEPSAELPLDTDPTTLSRRDALLGLARRQVAASRSAAAVSTVDRIVTLFPDRSTQASARLIEAMAWRTEGRSDRELEALVAFCDRDDASVDPRIRGIELAASAGDWDLHRQICRQLLAINPLLKLPHRELARGAEQQRDDATLIAALSALVTMDPVDAADTHYRLAAAHERAGNVEQARRHVLWALEQAPRYRDAHQLLRKLGPSVPASGEVLPPAAEPPPMGELPR